MKASKIYCFVIFIIIVSSCATLKASELAKTDFNPPPPEVGTRFLVFISDLHVGLGKQNGSWHPWEDFRWENAFNAFLAEISKKGSDNVDLVIVGDFLELWQPPADVKCEGINEDLGCTVEEMEKIVNTIIERHPNDFKSLREFVKRGNNRLHIIPGNHDSALVHPKVWAPVSMALGAESQRINFVTNGVWISPDQKIIAEHGHQIGNNENSYFMNWPYVFKQVNEKEYFIRTWGQNFVQKIFNEEERTYEIIDNLSPEIAGVKYKLEDTHIKEKVKDVAKFIGFNLFQTSIIQKMQILGDEEGERPSWDIDRGRKLGYKLFAFSLNEADPLRIRLLEETNESAMLRAELDNVAIDPKRLSDAEVNTLCDLLAINKAKNNCNQPVLGGSIESTLIPRSWVLREHIIGNYKKNRKKQLFIYGHTHKIETKWILEIGNDDKVSILNTGAFQRQIDNNSFLNLAKNENMSPNEALRKLKLEKHLLPCYPTVMVEYKNNNPDVNTLFWHMSENGKGEFVGIDNKICKVELIKHVQ
jgi:UDP-2,3-diacylglucosamine pyrophosphatase LpxH